MTFFSENKPLILASAAVLIIGIIVIIVVVALLIKNTDKVEPKPKPAPVDVVTPPNEPDLPDFVNGIPTGDISTMNSGDVMVSQNQLISPSGNFVAIQQSDGNLCTYEAKNGVYVGGQTWCSNAHPGNGSYQLIMQTDGNVCVYNKGTTTDSIWCSMSNGRGTGPWRLVMQDDGNLVEYDATNNAVWSTK